MNQYEIDVRPGHRVVVSYYIFRSWTGRRYLNGVEYHGPVYILGSGDYASARQARACDCAECTTQATTATEES